MSATSNYTTLAHDAGTIIATHPTCTAVTGERHFQDHMRTIYQHQGSPSLEAELLMLHNLVRQAEAAWYLPGNNNEVLGRIRCIAAVALRAMDNFGAVDRVY